MKRFVSIAVVFVLALSIAAVAGEQGKKMSVDEKVSWMAKELNLTSSQQASLKTILEEQNSKFEAVWKDASLSEDAKMAKKKEIKSNTSAQIKALLTTEQQNKLAAITAEKKTTAQAQ